MPRHGASYGCGIQRTWSGSCTTDTCSSGVCIHTPNAGQAGIGNGIYKIGLTRRDFDGVPYLTFRIRAYGDFKFATKVEMTTQLSVGSATGSLTAGWTPTSRGWKLPLSEF